MGLGTSTGPCRDARRSCWRVRSVEACFEKVWRALEGPQSASAMLEAAGDPSRLMGRGLNRDDGVY